MENLSQNGKDVQPGDETIGRGILSPDEIIELASWTVECGNGEWVPEDDIFAIIEWAEQTRFNARLLDAIMAKKLMVRWQDGDVCVGPAPSR